MTQAAFDNRDWQAVIDAHPLESHDPAEWLRYGVALLQTIEPGPHAAKQQQQSALAFVQAQKEGASQGEVRAAQRCSALISLQRALALAGLPFCDGLAEPEAGTPDAEPQSLVPVPLEPIVLADQQPISVLTDVLTRGFDLDVPHSASILDQLLAAKEELRRRKVGAGAVEAVLREHMPLVGPMWMEALDKILLVLR